MNINPCPFCRKDQPQLPSDSITLYFNKNERRVVYVRCAFVACNAKGPESDSLDGAIAVWNKSAEWSAQLCRQDKPSIIRVARCLGRPDKKRG